MRERFLIGAAVLLGVVSMSGEAFAACSDYLNEARRATTTPQRVNELLRLATADGCSPSVLDGIRARLNQNPQQDDKNEPDGQIENVMLPAPTARTLRALTVGSTARSSLTPENSVDPASGVAFEYWSFRAPAGERLQVSMTASEGSTLDTYLEVGRMGEGRFEEIASNDDRGDGTLNSMLRFTPEQTGDYVIRARSYWREQYGAYELIVQPTASLPTDPPIPRPLTVGAAQAGNLGPQSPVDAADGGYSYQLWTFQAEAGQRLQISMASNTFDTYLVVGRMRGGRFEEIASNDDRGDGTLNSLLRFVPDESGEYMVRARSYGVEQWGDYELRVQPTALVGERTPVEGPARAWVLQGDIAADAASDYVDFEFEATRGRRYNVRAMANEFTPIVDVGLLQEGGRLAEVDFYGAPDRAPNAAEFSAERRARYIIRVSAPALSGGHFDLIVNEAR